MTGSIFVPAMTRSSTEPKYRVFEGTKQVASALPGEKVFVTPGDYTVVVGSGAEESLMRFDVVVAEGETTFIPVLWSGLLVTVLDERGNSFRGSYELVKMPERDFVGIGLGADLAKGERLTSWYLPPGLYMILSPWRENHVEPRREIPGREPFSFRQVRAQTDPDKVSFRHFYQLIASPEGIASLIQNGHQESAPENGDKGGLTLRNNHVKSHETFFSAASDHHGIIPGCNEYLLSRKC